MMASPFGYDNHLSANFQMADYGMEFHSEKSISRYRIFMAACMGSQSMVVAIIAWNTLHFTDASLLTQIYFILAVNHFNVAHTVLTFCEMLYYGSTYLMFTTLNNYFR